MRARVVFRFNLFLFLITIYDIKRGHGSLRYFFTLGFLAFWLAGRAVEHKAVVGDVVQVT